MALKITGLSRDLLSHPGETIEEYLEIVNMTQVELAARIGVSAKHISKIINAQARITPDIASRLSDIFPAKAYFWNNLQRIYDEDLTEIEKIEKIKNDTQYFSNNLYNTLVKKEYLCNSSSKLNYEAKIIAIREFINVGELSFAEKVLSAQNYSFRKASNQNVDAVALLCWLKICEIETNKIGVTAPFNKELLKNKLPDIKRLNIIEDPNLFVPKLTNILKECGVAFSVVINLPGAPVQGVMQKDKESAKICLTLRQKWADIFWFTLFHELGHLLESKKSVYLDYISTDSDCQTEQIADEFAADMLIDNDTLTTFFNNNFINDANIKRFAQRNGVIPGIVVGRLLHLNRLPYKSHLCKLRTQYCWAN